MNRNNMELVIKDIKSTEDIRLITSLAKRLGLKTIKLSVQEKEGIGLNVAIEKGRKSGYVSEDIVMSALRKIQDKK